MRHWNDEGDTGTTSAGLLPPQVRTSAQVHNRVVSAGTCDDAGGHLARHRVLLAGHRTTCGNRAGSTGGTGVSVGDPNCLGKLARSFAPTGRGLLVTSRRLPAGAGGRACREVRGACGRRGCRAGSSCRGTGGAGCVRGGGGGVGGSTGCRVGDVLRPQNPCKPAEESQHGDDTDDRYRNHPAGSSWRRISTWRTRRESLRWGIGLRRRPVSQLRRLRPGLRPCLVVRWLLIVVRHSFIARSVVSRASNDKSWFDSIWPANGLSGALRDLDLGKVLARMPLRRSDCGHLRPMKLTPK